MPKFFKKPPTSQPQRRRDIAAARREELRGDDHIAQYSTFRRSHTLTGSASSEVSTLSEHAAQLKSPRVRSHELQQRRRQIIGIFALLLLLSGLLFAIISNFSAQFALTINGDASITSRAPYEQAIQSFMADNPAQRLRPLSDNAALTASLQAKYPEIQAAAIDGGTGLGTSHVSLTMRRPVTEWAVNGKNEYVDAKGIAFSQNYYSDPGVEIVDQSGIRVAANQALVSNSFLSFVGQVVGASKQLESMTVTQVTIPPDTTRQIAVTLAGVDYPIKMSTDRPAGEQVEDMARTVRWLSDHNQYPQYVDVRVAGEAYYK